MNNTFFTSDTHWQHFNIIAFCKRPFKTVEEMDEELIKRWNERVDKHDLVYHLGDFGFGDIRGLRSIRHRLNGKIILVVGNHDYKNKLHKQRDMFTDIFDHGQVSVNGQKFDLFHYPIYEWPGYYRGVIHLYGHVHNSTNDPKFKGAVNVGTDKHDFYPFSFDEVMNEVKNQGSEYLSLKSSMEKKSESDIQ